MADFAPACRGDVSHAPYPMKIPFALLVLIPLALFPKASASVLYGVTSSNQLVTFDTSAPSTFLFTTSISGLVASNGVTPDPFAGIVNLAYNYSDGQLYGLDSNSNFYRIGTNGSAILLSSSFSPNGFDAGLGFDPFSGNFVYGSDLAEQFNLGSTGTVTAGADFVYGTGDVNAATTPSIFGVAFDPDFGTAWFVDANLDTLSMSLDPGLGELLTVGGLGTDVTSFGDLTTDFQGNLYATLSTDGLTSSLYAINGATGEASLLGGYGAGEGRDLVTLAVPEPSTSLLGGLGAIALLRRRRCA
jgi:hypothetical protein